LLDRVFLLFLTMTVIMMTTCVEETITLTK